MGVVCCAPRTGIDPLRLLAFELVFEINLSRLDESRSRVLNLQVFLVWTNAQRRRNRHGSAVEESLFDDYGRRLRIGDYRFGVNHCCTIQCRKPQFTVPGPGAGRPHSPVTLHVQHAVYFSVSDGGNRGALSRRKLIQLAFAHAIDTAIATNPEIGASIFQGLKDAVTEQAIFDGVARELAILEAGKTAVVGPNPENSITIFVDRPDRVTGKSI